MCLAKNNNSQIHAVLLLGLGLFCMRRRRRRQQSHDEEQLQTRPSTNEGTSAAPSSMGTMGSSGAEMSREESSLTLPEIPGMDLLLQASEITWVEGPDNGRRLLGEGQFGKVYEAKLYGKEPVGVKCLALTEGPTAPANDTVCQRVTDTLLICLA